MGVVLIVHSKAEAPQAAGALQKVLGQVGFDTLGIVDPKAAQGSISLVVGYKP